MIIHHSNSQYATPGARVEMDSTPPRALLLKAGVVDRHLGNPNQSHLTLSCWPTPVFDGNRRIIQYELTGNVRLFGRVFEIPRLTVIRKQKFKALPSQQQSPLPQIESRRQS